MPSKKSVAMKATLLSAFLFPGAGHWYLKCMVRAWGFIIIAAIGLCLLMSSIFGIAFSIAEQISNGTVANDITVIYGLIQDAVETLYGTKDFGVAKILTIGTWVISTIDAYREGKKRDNDMQNKTQQATAL